MFSITTVLANQNCDQLRDRYSTYPLQTQAYKLQKSKCAFDLTCHIKKDKLINEIERLEQENRELREKLGLPVESEEKDFDNNDFNLDNEKCDCGSMSAYDYLKEISIWVTGLFALYISVLYLVKQGYSKYVDTHLSVKADHKRLKSDGKAKDDVPDNVKVESPENINVQVQAASTRV